MEKFIAGITFIGSMVGLATGLFVLFDRLFKGRPVAYFTVRGEGEQKEAVVSINNIGQHDIVILSVKCDPQVYFFVKEVETRDLIKGAMGEVPSFILAHGKERDLYFAAFIENGVAKDLKPQKISIRIDWRPGNSTWLWQYPVIVRTDTNTVRKFGLREYD